ncbi:polyamine aminopropyltransferase [Syntrophomonas palmitatica]|uniref:polyamine aminopropyltransferase n=1 Tax=Syntrophomonas palmitatica TaxID=402877 RepID=UPI0006D086C5|nr:polyamine aminopropyltransferase [Syntrophomonas palmitatica]
MHELWFNEQNSENYQVKWRVKKVLHHETTPYQELVILETEEWGKVLVLDGAFQVTEKDEFIYHEMIVHVVMNSHPNPAKVLIIGGGDGGTLRELCRHQRLKSVDMVEIDERVVANCRQYLPSIASAFADSRLKLYFADGIEFVKNTAEKYDVVIVDSSDPVGPAVELFGTAFYNNLDAILHDDGMVVVQSESPLYYTEAFKNTYNNLKSVFPLVKVYLADIPTYVSGPWSFTVGSKKHDPTEICAEAEKQYGLKYYNDNVHRGAFCLPSYIEAILRGNE